MQFIVIYGVRFIYGGQYRLSGDWGRVRPGRGSGLWPQRDLLGIEAVPHPGLGFMLGALALGSYFDKAHATWKCPSSPVPSSPRALSSG